MLILSDKLLLDIQLIHTFMPNMIHKPWMVSSKYVNCKYENKVSNSMTLVVGTILGYTKLDRFLPESDQD